MRKIVLALAATACVVPALAFAAVDPRKNSHFAWCPIVKTTCPLDFDTNKRGTKIINMTLYPKCAPVPIDSKRGTWPRMRVRNGKFSREGTVTDVTGDKITYKIKGKFTKPRKAVGTFDVDTKNCSERRREFVAKRTGKAKGPPL